MAPLRALLLTLALLAFFLVGVPVQAVLAVARPSAAPRVQVLFCRTMLRLLRVHVEQTGAPLAPAPVLIVANHVSWIDILALASLAPIGFLAKSEVASWPVIAAFARLQGTVFVDRKRRRSIPPANRAMALGMLAGRRMLLFPEGTTLDGSGPGRFLTSHFAVARDLLRLSPERAVVAVQPVAVAYSAPHAAWVGDEALLPNLWTVLRRPPLRCRLGIAPPIAVGREADRKLVARRAREAVGAMLVHAPAGRSERTLIADDVAATSGGEDIEG